jgi:hypothetical protein
MRSSKRTNEGGDGGERNGGSRTEVKAWETDRGSRRGPRGSKELGTAVQIGQKEVNVRVTLMVTITKVEHGM